MKGKVKLLVAGLLLVNTLVTTLPSNVVEAKSSEPKQEVKVQKKSKKKAKKKTKYIKTADGKMKYSELNKAEKKAYKTFKKFAKKNKLKGWYVNVWGGAPMTMYYTDGEMEVEYFVNAGEFEELTIVYNDGEVTEKGIEIFDNYTEEGEAQKLIDAYNVEISDGCTIGNASYDISETMDVEMDEWALDEALAMKVTNYID